MKSVVLVLSLILGNAATAQADVIPGFYQKLKTRFESASIAPTMADLPTVAERAKLSCVAASENDNTQDAKLVKISKTIGAGPLEPPKLIEKALLMSSISEDSERSLVDLVTQKVTQTADGKMALSVHVAETNLFYGTPMQFDIRKSDYLYIKLMRKNQTDMYVYCYPSQAAR